MPGLVYGEIAAVWQSDRGHQPPAPIGDLLRDFDALAGQLGERGRDVVTHQIELMPALSVGRMHGQLGRRQSEDKPALSGVHRR